jgi:D-sedoheptulose 7-phosphate isomerase
MTQSYLRQAGNRLIGTVTDTLVQCEGEFGKAVNIALAAIHGGHWIFTGGNGGSAASASHLAAELVGRYKDDRRSLRGLSLNENASTLTAIGNDYGFDNLFLRQLEGYGGPGDVLVVFTTSGKSKNILAVLETARAKGMRIILFTGLGGAELASQVDAYIAVPSKETARIQEVHDLAMHALCEAIDAHLLQAQ